MTLARLHLLLRRQRFLGFSFDRRAFASAA
jgi:hypothetical protein